MHLIILIILANFLVVNCGENFVDLTTHQLLPNKRLGEITIRTGGSGCGGSYIDNEFVSFIGGIVGTSAIQLLQANNSGQLQYMMQQFCTRVKFLFTGNKEEYETYELDLDEGCPVIKQYITGEKFERLDDDDWIIEITFRHVKEMFDPVLNKIIRLIHNHLDHSGAISAIFLVGGLSNSKYLQKRIREEFSNEIRNIYIPRKSEAAVVRGGNYKIDDLIIFCIL